MLYKIAGQTINERALAGSRLRGNGIEIGASHMPIRVDPARCRVRYVDRLSAEDIRERFPELAGCPIVNTDVQCDVATDLLSGFASSSLDFVIASHVLEHVPNPLGLFREIHRVLQDGGFFYLGLPDKDYTFDKDRAVTSLEHLIEDLERGTKHYDAFHFEDYLLRAAKKPIPSDAKEYEAVFREECGRSFHVHVFTWRSVLQFVRYMITTRGVGFALVELYLPKRVKNEVILLLKKRSLPGKLAGLLFDARYAVLRAREMVIEVVLKASGQVH